MFTVFSSLAEIRPHSFNKGRNLAINLISRGVLPALLIAGLMSTFGVAQANAEAQTYTISGRVTDGYNNGISGATVTLSGTQAGVIVTDPDGNYFFSNLVAGGNYMLSPSKPGQYTAFAANVSNLSGNQTVDLRLHPYMRVNVRVIDGSGNGVAGVTIQIG